MSFGHTLVLRAVNGVTSVSPFYLLSLSHYVGKRSSYLPETLSTVRERIVPISFLDAYIFSITRFSESLFAPNQRNLQKKSLFKKNKGYNLKHKGMHNAVSSQWKEVTDVFYWHVSILSCTTRVCHTLKYYCSRSSPSFSSSPQA